ncbi:hypothetical protein CYY_009714 [Polysphondylium violaceum]|uniref:Transmembrane protein n=1 Tax=Polysphondylium violaceum TaxID=133409 RepID=A0A8J4PJV6_9MYCE|nr:hypothetical protein CYY_009714 [Polysphondylium violaceum]
MGKKSSPSPKKSSREKKREEIVEEEEYIEEEEEDIDDVPVKKKTTTTRITTTQKPGTSKLKKVIEKEVEDLDFDRDENYIKTTTTTTTYNNGNTRPGDVLPEEIFYQPTIYNTRGGKKRGGNGNASVAAFMGPDSWDDAYPPSRCERVAYYDEGYDPQETDSFTQQQLEILSGEIRRHPSLAAKSYHFLSLGISTKIQHQWIQIVIASLITLSLIAIVVLFPLPAMKHIQMSVKGPNIQATTAKEFDKDFADAHGQVSVFKDDWRRFAIVGTSNFLCSNYNFNPITGEGNDYIWGGGASFTNNSQELKNVKIFGSCILFGVLLFFIWLVAAKLSEKEIIMESSAGMQIAHAILTLGVIPLLAMVFWALFVLYFIQTILIGAPFSSGGGSGEFKQDVFHCVNRLSVGLGELNSFSPIRELFLGSVGILMRLVNRFHPLPIEALALHEKTESLSNNDMKLVSFIWALGVGSTIYHFLTLCSYLYSIFHESPKFKKDKQNNAANANAAAAAIAASSSSTRAKPVSLMTLDLKFLPSFIPEVLLTQNFIITLIWWFTASYLWIFGVPSCIVAHEGEIFYLVMSLTPILKSIYNLVIIEQNKDTINRLHTENSRKSENIVESYTPSYN